MIRKESLPDADQHQDHHKESIIYAETDTNSNMLLLGQQGLLSSLFPPVEIFMVPNRGYEKNQQGSGSISIIKATKEFKADANHNPNKESDDLRNLGISIYNAMRSKYSLLLQQEEKEQESKPKIIKEMPINGKFTISSSSSSSSLADSNSKDKDNNLNSKLSIMKQRLFGCDCMRASIIYQSTPVNDHDYHLPEEFNSTIQNQPTFSKSNGPSKQSKIHILDSMRCYAATGMEYYRLYQHYNLDELKCLARYCFINAYLSIPQAESSHILSEAFDSEEDTVAYSTAYIRSLLSLSKVDFDALVEFHSKEFIQKNLQIIQDEHKAICSRISFGGLFISFLTDQVKQELVKFIHSSVEVLIAPDQIESKLFSLTYQMLLVENAPIRAIIDSHSNENNGKNELQFPSIKSLFNIVRLIKTYAIVGNTADATRILDQYLEIVSQKPKVIDIEKDKEALDRDDEDDTTRKNSLEANGIVNHSRSISLLLQNVFIHSAKCEIVFSELRQEMKASHPSISNQTHRIRAVKLAAYSLIKKLIDLHMLIVSELNKTSNSENGRKTSQKKELAVIINSFYIVLECCINFFNIIGYGNEPSDNTSKGDEQDVDDISFDSVFELMKQMILYASNASKTVQQTATLSSSSAKSSQIPSLNWLSLLSMALAHSCLLEIIRSFTQWIDQSNKGGFSSSVESLPISLQVFIINEFFPLASEIYPFMDKEGNGEIPIDAVTSSYAFSFVALLWKAVLLQKSHQRWDRVMSLSKSITKIINTSATSDFMISAVSTSISSKIQGFLEPCDKMAISKDDWIQILKEDTICETPESLIIPWSFYPTRSDHAFSLTILLTKAHQAISTSLFMEAKYSLETSTNNNIVASDKDERVQHISDQLQNNNAIYIKAISLLERAIERSNASLHIIESAFDISKLQDSTLMDLVDTAKYISFSSFITQKKIKSDLQNSQHFISQLLDQASDECILECSHYAKSENFDDDSLTAISILMNRIMLSELSKNEMQIADDLNLTSNSKCFVKKGFKLDLICSVFRQTISAKAHVFGIFNAIKGSDELKQSKILPNILLADPHLFFDSILGDLSNFLKVMSKFRGKTESTIEKEKDNLNIEKDIEWIVKLCWNIGIWITSEILAENPAFSNFPALFFTKCGDICLFHKDEAISKNLSSRAYFSAAVSLLLHECADKNFLSFLMNRSQHDSASSNNNYAISFSSNKDGISATRSNHAISVENEKAVKNHHKECGNEAKRLLSLVRNKLNVIASTNKKNEQEYDINNDLNANADWIRVEINQKLLDSLDSLASLFIFIADDNNILAQVSENEKHEDQEEIFNQSEHPLSIFMIHELIKMASSLNLKHLCQNLAQIGFDHPIFVYFDGTKRNSLFEKSTITQSSLNASISASDNDIQSRDEINGHEFTINELLCMSSIAVHHLVMLSQFQSPHFCCKNMIICLQRLSSMCEYIFLRFANGKLIDLSEDITKADPFEKKIKILFDLFEYASLTGWDHGVSNHSKELRKSTSNVDRDTTKQGLVSSKVNIKTMEGKSTDFEHSPTVSSFTSSLISSSIELLAQAAKYSIDVNNRRKYDIHMMKKIHRI